MDAIFDENFTSPLCMPDLPFQGALKLRGINTPILNTKQQFMVASTRLLKCLIADAAQNKLTIYQLDFIQAFI